MVEKIINISGQRLDAWLAINEPDHSRARWQTLIKEGFVTLNDAPTKPNCKLQVGDRLSWTVPDPISTEVLPEDIPLDVIYEDAHMIAINKPAGLVVHPASGNETGTLVNALLHHCQDLAGIGGEKRPGIVHRLDKDTSGVMVVAKTEKALNELARQFKERETEKEYIAIVRGVPSTRRGRIETTIGRHPRHRKKMAADVRNGRRAISNYEVVETFHNATLVRVYIETGRTHQIRVHMAHLQHPVLGDKLYSRSHPDDVKADRQMLHAAKLSIAHPDTGERMWLRAPLPPDMEAVLDTLRDVERKKQSNPDQSSRFKKRSSRIRDEKRF